MSEILVIDDELSMRLGLVHTLKAAGHNVTAAETGTEGLWKVKEMPFDLVITDLRMPGADGMAVLETVKSIQPKTGVIVITAFAEVKSAVDAMKRGAYDYISKPFVPEELLMVVDRFFTQQKLLEDNKYLHRKLLEHEQFENIVGTSPSMQTIFNSIRTVAKTDASVIVYGESGTGKELVVNAIHKLSSRRDKPFFKINCAAIPESLLEAELCGYEKGAFTGATQRRKGKLEVSNGGTFFFDEIGDMTPQLQAKLLRILENRSFERVGGTETVHLDIRFIFATMRNLHDEIGKGRFREDLFYRINVLPINMPALRDRPDDILILAHHFVEQFRVQQGKQAMEISPEASCLLLSYPFPGNIRELKHAIEMAVTFCPDSVIIPTFLPVEIQAQRLPPKDTSPQQFHSLETDLSETERQLLLNALQNSGWKKSAAAKALGISRETLWRKLKEYNISQTD